MVDKKTLLVCMTDFPFPARKNGISIRYYPILEHAAKSFDIHLVCIVAEKLKDEQLEEANRLCDKVSIYVRERKQASLVAKVAARICTLKPGGTPFNQLRYDEKEIENFLRGATCDKHYDLALTVLVDYLALVKRIISADRFVLDVIDSPYATRLRTQGQSPLSRYDGWVTKCWERKAIKEVSYACYISPLDREIGAGKNINEERIGIIPNGLFIDDHSNEYIDFNSTTIGYLGHMGYPPNIRAALRLYRIFKSVRHKIPNLRLIIIGRDPAADILALQQDADVVITGAVPNIWPYINGVNIFVFPMEIGSGQQNKLLEAMGAGKAVISSALGNSGVRATPNQDIVIANHDEEFAEAISSLLLEPSLRDGIGISGKKFVTKTYSWPAILGKIDSTLLSTHRKE